MHVVGWLWKKAGYFAVAVYNRLLLQNIRERRSGGRADFVAGFYVNKE